MALKCLVCKKTIKIKENKYIIGSEVVHPACLDEWIRMKEKEHDRRVELIGKMKKLCLSVDKHEKNISKKKI